ncbi:FliH/SctL family protein [Undibacterium sp. Di26W]|uniref:FliH/SctL family protein n=1 Tax=Undibacterium sp. Di26W TaxID=3413035 RepID=UPI003BF05CD5
MASIIRSATLSGHKRTLATRATKDKPPESPDVPIASNSANEEQPGAKPNIVKPTDSNKAVNDLVEQARLSVLAQIKDEAEAARELGRQRGLREGRQAGLEEAKSEFAAEFSRIKSMTEKLPMAIETGIKGIEDLAVAVVFESVCKILGDTVVSQDGVKAIVRQVAQRVSIREKLVIRLNPSDFKILESGGILESTLPAPTLEQISWIADSDIALGGCILETAVGDLDARLETQLENLRMTLLSARKSQAS